MGYSLSRTLIGSPVTPLKTGTTKSEPVPTNLHKVLPCIGLKTVSQIKPQPTAPQSLCDDPSWQVPAHNAIELNPQKANYAVCVFVLNEGDRLKSQLAKMQPYLPDADIILADGGSTDGATDPNYLRSMGVRALLVKTGPGKLGAQMRMAFAWCLKNGYQGVITIDGNDKDGVDAIPRFVAALQDGVDYVQGSRFIPGGKAINTPFARYWGIILVHAPMLSLASFRRFTDTTNGFRAYTPKLLADPRIAVFRDILSGYEMHYYLAVRAARLGYNVREIPVVRSYPPTGKTPTKIHGFRANFGILQTLAKVCLGGYNPAPQLGNK